MKHFDSALFNVSPAGCDARFAAKSSMYVHVKKHTAQLAAGAGPVTYFCPFEGCARSFPNKSSLRQHISKHYRDTIAQG